MELENQVGHQNRSKDNANSNRVSSKISIKPSDTQNRKKKLYE